MATYKLHHIYRYSKAQAAELTTRHVLSWVDFLGWSLWAEMIMQFHAKVDTKIVPPDLHKHSPSCAALPTLCKEGLFPSNSITGERKRTGCQHNRRSSFQAKYQIHSVPSNSQSLKSHSWTLPYALEVETDKRQKSNMKSSTKLLCFVSFWSLPAHNISLQCCWQR